MRVKIKSYERGEREWGGERGNGEGEGPQKEIRGETEWEKGKGEGNVTQQENVNPDYSL